MKHTLPAADECFGNSSPGTPGRPLVSTCCAEPANDILPSHSASSASTCDCQDKPDVPGCCPPAPGSADEVCCGSPPGPISSEYDRAGYRLLHFVTGFIDTPVGRVPQISTKLEMSDWVGTVRARSGFGRNNYLISPGLYAVGRPDGDAPVLVTANYKLTVDVLRSRLPGCDLWLVVLDTRGINVWCAAGKALFGTRELVRQVTRCRLAQLVDHRRLVLPQLGATGVSAHEVKKACGFEVVWGPVRADDIKPFFQDNYHAEPAMRRVTFTLPERLVLIPVEITFVFKAALCFLLVGFLLSGILGRVFDFGVAWTRSGTIMLAYGVGVVSGMVLIPALLPWVPGRAFAVKGLWAGLVAGVLSAPWVWRGASAGEAIALFLVTGVVSSYLGMNFTGSTPFTSPSGVEKEMRRAIPLQVGSMVLAALLWIVAGIR